MRTLFSAIGELLGFLFGLALLVILPGFLLALPFAIMAGTLFMLRFFWLAMFKAWGLAETAISWLAGAL